MLRAPPSPVTWRGQTARFGPLDLRESVVRFFRGIAEAMLLIIRWVFAVAPIGVFALAVVVGARLGYTAVTAVGYYIAVFALLILSALVLAYLSAVLIGRVSLRRFAAAVAPAQVIALGSRSSSAALPAMIDAARDQLRLPTPIVSFVLPAAVAVFRISAPISFVLGALFLGKLYGVAIDQSQVASLVVLSILLSYSVPPVPSGSLFLMAPVFAELGIPVEGIAILIAIDVIPDLLKTATIVTGHMASAVVVLGYYFVALFGGFFARIAREDSCLRAWLLRPAVIDDLESSVLQFQRIVTQKQIEVTPLERLDRFDRRNGRFDVITFLRQNKTVGREYGTLIVDYENREFLVV